MLSQDWEGAWKLRRGMKSKKGGRKLRRGVNFFLKKFKSFLEEGRVGWQNTFSPLPWLCHCSDHFRLVLDLWTFVLQIMNRVLLVFISLSFPNTNLECLYIHKYVGVKPFSQNTNQILIHKIQSISTKMCTYEPAHFPFRFLEGFLLKINISTLHSIVCHDDQLFGLFAVAV